MNSFARVKTDRASRYCQQLCKHFGHKVPVTFDATMGKIELPMGVCQLAVADDAYLDLEVSASNERDLSKLEQVVADHFERFAFKEELKVIWNDKAA